jgi:UDP-GlcNAc:undecaprenyl-phosphate GlcNAc-1-phosphate transferase
MMLTPISEVAISFTATAGLILLLNPMAIKVGLVDLPDSRKLHRGTPAMIGGIAIWLGVFIYLFSLADIDPITGCFLLSTGLMVFVGTLDDRFNLPVPLRIGVEVAVASIMIVFADLWVGNIGNLLGFGEMHLSPWVAYPFTVVAVFGVINAINMIDGLDGLAASIALAAIILLLIFGDNSSTLSSVGPPLVGALGAFLVFNIQFTRVLPKVFLGDAGSKLIGLTLVWVLIETAQSDTSYRAGINPATALYLIGIPLIDMVVTTLRRIYTKQPPFKADRSHIHHLLLDAEFSKTGALVIILGLSVAVNVLGLVLNWHNVSELIQFAIIFGLFIVYGLATSYAWGLLAAKLPIAKASDPTQAAPLDSKLR